MYCIITHNMNPSTLRVINLSIDRKLFDPESAVSKRFVEYGKRCAEMHVIVHTPLGFSQLQLSPNVTIYPTNSVSKFSYVRDALRCAANIIKPGMVITSQDAFTHVVGVKLKRKFGNKLELQYHTDFMSPYFRKESLKNYIRYRLYVWSLSKADSIRVVSERIKRSISQKVHVPISVVPIFVDIQKIDDQISQYKGEKMYPQFNFVFLLASRLEQEKNIEMAIEAFAGISQAFPKTGMVIVGSGSQEQYLRKLTHKLNMQEKIIFPGWAESLIPFYASASAFLLPSNYEGYGLTLVEAATARIPIVSTDVGIVGGMLTPGADVLSCRVKDEVCFRIHMLRLISDTALYERIRMNAYQTIMGQTQKYDDYLDAYIKTLLLLTQ